MKAVNDATEGNSKEALVVFFIVTEVLASPKEDLWPTFWDIIDGPHCMYKYYDK